MNRSPACVSIAATKKSVRIELALGKKSNVTDQGLRLWPSTEPLAAPRADPLEALDR
jgi:hypothetical protein